MLDIILLTHNNLESTRKCVEALYQNTLIPFNLTVIDDSTDDTPGYFSHFSHITSDINYFRPRDVIKSANQAINIGVKMTQSDPFVFLINTAIVGKEWLITAQKLMEGYKIGLVGFKLVDPETHKIVDAMGGGIGEPEGNYTFASVAIRVPWAAVLINRKALPERGLDEDYYIGFRGVDDTDNCFTIRRRGWKIIYDGYNTVYHHPSSSNGMTEESWKETNENCRRFLEKWKDDYYTKNCGITYDSRI